MCIRECLCFFFCSSPIEEAVFPKEEIRRKKEQMIADVYANYHCRSGLGPSNQGPKECVIPETIEENEDDFEIENENLN